LLSAFGIALYIIPINAQASNFYEDPAKNALNDVSGDYASEVLKNGKMWLDTFWRPAIIDINNDANRFPIEFVTKDTQWVADLQSKVSDIPAKAQTMLNEMNQLYENAEVAYANGNYLKAIDDIDAMKKIGWEYDAIIKSVGRYRGLLNEARNYTTYELYIDLSKYVIRKKIANNEINAEEASICSDSVNTNEAILNNIEQIFSKIRKTQTFEEDDNNQIISLDMKFDSGKASARKKCDFIFDLLPYIPDKYKNKENWTKEEWEEIQEYIKNIISQPIDKPVAYESSAITVNKASSNVTNPFTDTNINELEGKAISDLYSRSIIRGYSDGEFKGEESVNRAEAAKFLLLAKGLQIPDIKNNGKFWDVKEGEWYVKYVMTAAQNGIISGYPDGSFKPADTVNTAEFLKMLTLSFNLQTNLSYSYTDVKSDDWFSEYAGVAQKYNLFPKRTAKLLQPSRLLSRNEVAVAIYQYLSSK
jgi:hypothetical protein